MNIIHIAAKGNEIYGVGYKPISVDVENGTVTFDVDSFSPFLLVRSPIEYYGRNALSALSNKEALLYAYDQIVRGVENSTETIRILMVQMPLQRKNCTQCSMHTDVIIQSISGLEADTVSTIIPILFWK